MTTQSGHSLLHFCCYCVILGHSVAILRSLDTGNSHAVRNLPMRAEAMLCPRTRASKLGRLHWVIQGLRHTELHNILFAESPAFIRLPKPLHGSDLRECSDDDKLPIQNTRFCSIGVRVGSRADGL